MGRNNRAKYKKSNASRAKECIDYLEKSGYTVLTPNKILDLKNEVTEYVMKRAYVMVLASFLDNGRTFWKDYFRGKAKMNEFMGLCIEQIELYGRWVDEDKIVHFDEIAEWIYDNYGKDFRTEWMKSHKDQELREERAKLMGRKYW